MMQSSPIMIEFKSIINIPTPLEELKSEIFTKKKVRVFIKRDELTHPLLSGNKFRKLKYNLLEAKNNPNKTLVTFGGAYSNHIYSLAAAGKLFGFNTKAIIRGDELNENSSPTLKFAADSGMKLEFVSRDLYRNKQGLIDKLEEDYFLVPEGGSNTLALLGVSEMVQEILSELNPDYICAAMGTGGTIAGILSNYNYQGKTIGIPVLKNGSFLRQEVAELLKSEPKNFEMFLDYHFGGYGKSNNVLERFIDDFEFNYQISIEHVYTAKLLYAIFDLINSNYFKEDSVIVIIHTGGLQGKKNKLTKIQ